MSNKNDKIKQKLKALKGMYLLVAGLTGVFTLLIIIFFVIVVISASTKTTTPETSVQLQAQITPDTEIFVYKVCVNTGMRFENLQMIQEIKELQRPTRQGLHTFLISKGKTIDIVQEFTSNRVVVEYEIDNCEKCLDDSIYMAIDDSRLVFFQGIPTIDNKIGFIDEEVLIMDVEKRQMLIDGIKLEDHELYLGIHTGMTLAVYSGKPGDINPPLFIFPRLRVSADLVTFLKEEEAFKSMEHLLDLIESYAR